MVPMTTATYCFRKRQQSKWKRNVAFAPSRLVPPERGTNLASPIFGHKIRAFCLQDLGPMRDCCVLFLLSFIPQESSWACTVSLSNWLSRSEKITVFHNLPSSFFHWFPNEFPWQIKDSRVDFSHPMYNTTLYQKPTD